MIKTLKFTLDENGDITTENSGFSILEMIGLHCFIRREIEFKFITFNERKRIDEQKKIKKLKGKKK